MFFPLSKQMSCREISQNHNPIKIKKINSYKEKMLSKQPSHFEKSPSHFDRAHIQVPRIKIPDIPCLECQGYVLETYAEACHKISTVVYRCYNGLHEQGNREVFGHPDVLACLQ